MIGFPLCISNFFYDVITCSVALLLGAIGGGLVGAIVAIVTWKKTIKSRTAYELLREALQIQALKEAWIYVDSDYDRVQLSALKQKNILSEKFIRVEVRAVLDESPWNFPEKNFFEFINGRRTWIVRNQIQKRDHETKIISYPAILSSKAIEELSGWIEKVYIAKSGKMLSADGLNSLKPLLNPILLIGALEEFKLNERISNKAYEFLISKKF